MDIRTKLVFALVSVSLASMLALGVVTYGSVESELRERRLQQLEGVADLKTAAVERVVAGWIDRVALVARRSELRLSLGEYERAGGSAPVSRIQRVLSDAVGASVLFDELSVYDAEGQYVTGSGDGGEAIARPPTSGVELTGVGFTDDGRTLVTWDAAIVVDRRPIGVLRAVLDARSIAALSRNYAGLGETGETLVVAELDGRVRVLHPVRFPLDGLTMPGAFLDDDRSALAALGDEILTTGRRVDYRGAEVWAATRRLASTRWGVVVKVDESEHSEPVAAVRDDMIRLAVTLAAFAIALGTLVGIRFAQPIIRLAEASSQIGEGKLDTRSGIERQDEIGLLARTFDDMAEALEGQVGLLSEYRRFFDLSIDMLCIASTDGYFKKVNEAFVRELGWSEEELVSVPFLDRIHPDDREATVAELERLAEGLPTIRFTNRYQCKDGTFKRMRWNAYPEADTGTLFAIARVRDESGEPAS